MKTFKIFKYIETLDGFIIDPEYKQVAQELGLSEWNEVVWIGRFFTLDSDYGEHWFDNWELREGAAQMANELGIDTSDLYLIDPNRFRSKEDPAGHSDAEIKAFWTDVLKSLELSLDNLCREALRLDARLDPEDRIVDLAARIQRL
jgi:hypothetical protein